MYEPGVIYQDSPEDEPYLVIDGIKVDASLVDLERPEWPLYVAYDNMSPDDAHADAYGL